VKCHAFAVVAAAGCAAEAPSDYPVDAVALLTPLRVEPPYIAGPIEVLGTGKPSTVPDSGPRTLAAYRVQLRDDLDPMLALVNARSCADRDPLQGPDGVPFQDLGVLRRVGEETHFLVPVQEGSQIIYVDTETTVAFTSRNARSHQIVIAVSPNDLRVLACGELTWQ
jgi:hypothetical protein